MNKLIDYVKDKYYPEYYETKFNFSDNNMNVIYHELKPNKFELTRQQSEKSGSYSTFEGSPFSQGLFQFDLWNKEPSNKDAWANLRNQVKQFGTRNSLLTALMPTASTSQILGNNECFEAFTSNIYSRKTQAGTFTMVCKYLVNDLVRIGLWSKELKDNIIANNGSVQKLDIPSEIKAIYKTIWEIKQIWVLKGAVARGPFVDQTQSMNIFMAEPDFIRLGSSHFWAWKNGLKTGMYYLRTKPSSDAIKFTIDPQLVKDVTMNSECINCSA
jgi:ribonucleotide reductase alpha subunit